MKAPLLPENDLKRKNTNVGKFSKILVWGLFVVAMVGVGVYHHHIHMEESVGGKGSSTLRASSDPVSPAAATTPRRPGRISSPHLGESEEEEEEDDDVSPAMGRGKFTRFVLNDGAPASVGVGGAMLPIPGKAMLPIPGKATLPIPGKAMLPIGGKAMLPMAGKKEDGFDPSKVPQLTPAEKAAFTPVTEPKGITAWPTMSAFQTPVRGEKNLFTFWGGAEPAPIILAFFDTMYRNRGEFKLFLITDANKERYLSLPAEGKQIAPDHKTKAPRDTHVSWEVLHRILTRGALPVAAQKDFILNTMVAFFGGVYMDPGIIGRGKLDQYWKLMQDNGVTYLNYADEMYRDDEMAGQNKKCSTTDKDGAGKWNGDMWIDSFFTMVMADAAIMKCWLQWTAQDPEFGPAPTQANHSPYFIYGGDTLDSCFASVYKRRGSAMGGGIPQGVNIYARNVIAPKPKRSPKEQNDFVNGFSIALPTTGSETAISTGRRLLAAKRSASPAFNLNFEGLEGLCDGGCDQLTAQTGRMITRMISEEASPPGAAFKDPPNIGGIPLGFDYDGKGIIIDQSNAEDIKAKLFARYTYGVLAVQVHPNLEELVALKHPTALLVRTAINSMNSLDGGIYLKFYDTAGELFGLSWQELCGPPISFAMYLLKEVTGHNLCTGDTGALASVSAPVRASGSASVVPARGSSSSGGAPMLALPIKAKRLSKNVN